MTTVEDVLEHFGVKGMKWGVRRRSSVDRAPSNDASSAKTAADKAKKGGLHTLTNAELQTLVNRMNLEQQFSRLQPQSATSKVGTFVSDILVDIGKQQAKKYVADFAAQSIGAAIKAKAKG